MQFSTKAEYGLRAIVRLAQKSKKGPYSLARIAKEEKISLAYLERLVAKLKKAKFIKSVKGIKGGYQLSKPAKEISVAKIIETLEGTLAPYCCLLPKTLCANKNCLTKKVWRKLYVGTKKILGSITLADLIK